MLLGVVWLATSASVANAAVTVARHGLTPAQYQELFTDLAGKGYRLKAVSGYTSNGQERYAALWTKTSGPPWAARHGMSSAQYQAAFSDYGRRGYRLVYVSGYAVNDQPRLAAIWEKASGPAWTARHNLTAAQYQQAFDDLTSKGYRLRHVSGYTVKGQDLYAAIWEKSKGPAWVARHRMTASQYQRAFEQYARQGYRLRVVSGYQTGRTDRYAAIWEKTGGPAYAARHGVADASYQGIFDNFAYQGYDPVYVEAFTSNGRPKFNGIWENTTWKAADLDLITSKVAAYMKTYGAPGLSLAITKDGRLVYAAGFGEADTSTGEEVTPDHLFRIASVSKPITSVAIMRLVEQGKLTLDARVFGPNTILGTKYSTPFNNRRIEQITVRQLLQHVGGFQTPDGDPMFQNTDYTHDELINWALKAKAPNNVPGTVYQYSNFGYSLLGRIIERITAQPYEQWVQKNVLAPAGISRMSIAGNSLDDRKPGEVRYYPSGAYNLNVTRFDAHGGWIATPIDLMRLMVRVDGLPTKPDIISASTYKTMTTKAGIKDAKGNDPGYAFGWVVGSGYQWHNGAMTGTIALMGRAPGGFGYAAVVNTRPSKDTFVGNLKQMLDDIVAGVASWPGYDLFS